MARTEQNIQLEASKPMGTSSSACKKKYKGVRMRSWGSWVSEIRAPNQKTRIWLGSYSTPEAAARAYDAALLCLKGSSANLNFPITSSHYIPDTVLSPKSIQRVAAAAANNGFTGHNVTASNTLPVSSPSLVSSSSSSISSDQFDDAVTLLQSFQTCNEPMAPMLDSLYNFDFVQSPKYLDQMFSGVSFNPPTMDDFYEGDIRLWSFAE